MANVGESGESVQHDLANVGESGESVQHGLANIGESGESRIFLKTVVLASTRTRLKWRISGEYSNSPSSSHCLLILLPYIFLFWFGFESSDLKTRPWLLAMMSLSSQCERFEEI